MVRAAANLHGFLLQHAHAGRGFAGVQHAGLGSGIDESLLIFVCHGGYARHALQDVQHQALGLQEALLAALHAHDDVAGANVGAVLNIHLHLQLGVEAAEHLLGNLHAGKDSLFLDEQFALAHLVGRDAT